MGDEQEQQPTANRTALRIGGACALAGGLLVAGFRLSHGDLPAADAAAALRFITHHPFYAGVHLGAIVGVLAWVGGFVALAGTLKHGAGNVFGRLGAASALVGAAIFIVDFSIDGVAGQGLAEAWAAASPSDQADVELAAQTAFTILRGTSLTSIIILWGLPLMLFGRAMMLENFPTWMGWAGLTLGAATVLGGIGLLFDRDLFPGVLYYGLLVSLVVQLWGFALGLTMWRRAGAPGV